MNVVYFSNVSENTHKFVQKLGATCYRIPVTAADALSISAPYVLITPTYGAGRGNSVPKQVIKFLNDTTNRSYMQGVIATGNTNFGARFCLAGRVIAEKCNVPLLHQLELMGTSWDVANVRNLLNEKELVR